jgi:hypothetical protein
MTPIALQLYGIYAANNTVGLQQTFNPWINNSNQISSSYPQVVSTFTIDLLGAGGSTLFNLGVCISVHGYVMWTGNNGGGSQNVTSFIYTHLSSSLPTTTGTGYTTFPYEEATWTSTTGIATSAYRRGPPSRVTAAGQNATATIDVNLFQANYFTSGPVPAFARYLTIGLASQFDNGQATTTTVARRTTIGWPTAAGAPHSTSGFSLRGQSSGFDYGEGNAATQSMNPVQLEIRWSKIS